MDVISSVSIVSALELPPSRSETAQETNCDCAELPAENLHYNVPTMHVPQVADRSRV